MGHEVETLECWELESLDGSAYIGVLEACTCITMLDQTKVSGTARVQWLTSQDEALTLFGSIISRNLTIRFS